MPFGEVRDITGSQDPITQTDFTYTGQRDMGGMGLMDYRARFYSPLLGRFTQPDTIVQDRMNPRYLNRFSYVMNNPLLYTDPTGYLTMCQLDQSLCNMPQPDEADNVIKELTLFIKADQILKDYGHGPEPNPEANDLEAMAKIVEKAADIYDGDWDQMLPALTGIFNGVQMSGPGTLITSALNSDRCAGVGRSTRDCPSNQYSFGDVGFHPDFRDGDNQLYHVWAYIAETATPGKRPLDGFGYIIGNIANGFHEVIQAVLGIDLDGTSWEDYFLSVEGMEIGMQIANGTISPYNLGNVLRLE